MPSQHVQSTTNNLKRGAIRENGRLLYCTGMLNTKISVFVLQGISINSGEGLSGEKGGSSKPFG